MSRLQLVKFCFRFLFVTSVAYVCVVVDDV